MTCIGHAPKGVFERGIVRGGLRLRGNGLVQQTERSGSGGGFRAIADAKLGTNVGGVFFGCLGGNDQLLGNLAVCETCGDQI